MHSRESLDCAITAKGTMKNYYAAGRHRNHNSYQNRARITAVCFATVKLPIALINFRMNSQANRVPA